MHFSYLSLPLVHTVSPVSKVVNVFFTNFQLCRPFDFADKPEPKRNNPSSATAREKAEEISDQQGLPNTKVHRDGKVFQAKMCT